MPIPNSDFVPDPFPGISAAGTVAPGSTGANPGSTSGPVVGSVQVSPTGLNDGGRGRVTVDVHSGDTSSMSDDVAAHGSILNGQDDADLMNTGAGDGSVVAAKRYPWQQQAGGR